MGEIYSIDELYHWGLPNGQHRYIAKIGEGINARYFYTQQQLDAYKRGLSGRANQTKQNIQQAVQNKAQTIATNAAKAGIKYVATHPAQAYKVAKTGVKAYNKVMNAGQTIDNMNARVNSAAINAQNRIDQTVRSAGHVANNLRNRVRQGVNNAGSKAYNQREQIAKSYTAKKQAAGQAVAKGAKHALVAGLSTAYANTKIGKSSMDANRRMINEDGKLKTANIDTSTMAGQRAMAREQAKMSAERHKIDEVEKYTAGNIAKRSKYAATSAVNQLKSNAGRKIHDAERAATDYADALSSKDEKWDAVKQVYKKRYQKRG